MPARARIATNSTAEQRTSSPVLLPRLCSEDPVCVVTATRRRLLVRGMAVRSRADVLRALDGLSTEWAARPASRDESRDRLAQSLELRSSSPAGEGRRPFLVGVGVVDEKQKLLVPLVEAEGETADLKLNYRLSREPGR